ncbi:winged helix-turn-helix transcriptional regulator [Betaproteobacteria bacterium]|nr:winged helix-turn-helix transcriptional regulator [Betaproteobacteria bacterium]
MPLIFVIQSDPMRLRQIKRAFNPIAEQKLTKQLRKSEKHNPNERKGYKTVPTKVEYFLTDFGRSFTPINGQFRELGKNIKRTSSLVPQLGECFNYKSIYAYIF